MFSCWSILQQDPKSNPPTAGNLTGQTIKINYPFQDDFPIFHMTICNIFPITIQWPSQEPKLEVPTIYKAYFSGLCKGISPQNMAWNMVLTYLHFRILEFPLNNVDPTLRPAAGFCWNNRQLRSSLFLGTNQKATDDDLKYGLQSEKCQNVAIWGSIRTWPESCFPGTSVTSAGSPELKNSKVNEGERWWDLWFIYLDELGWWKTLVQTSINKWARLLILYAK